MKAVYQIILASLLFTGCAFESQRSYKPASSLDELKSIIAASYRSGKTKPVELLIRKENTSKEVLDQSNAIISWIFSGSDKGYKLDKIELLPVNEYIPKMNLPGELNGRKLEYYPEPKWWLRLKTKRSESSTSSIELAISEAEGEFFICGADYIEEKSDPVE